MRKGFPTEKGTNTLSDEIKGRLRHISTTFSVPLQPSLHWTLWFSYIFWLVVEGQPMKGKTWMKWMGRGEDEKRDFRYVFYVWCGMVWCNDGVHVSRRASPDTTRKQRETATQESISTNCGKCQRLIALTFRRELLVLFYLRRCFRNKTKSTSFDIFGGDEVHAPVTRKFPIRKLLVSVLDLQSAS